MIRNGIFGSQNALHVPQKILWNTGDAQRSNPDNLRDRGLRRGGGGMNAEKAKTALV